MKIKSFPWEYEISIEQFSLTIQAWFDANPGYSVKSVVQTDKGLLIFYTE